MDLLTGIIEIIISILSLMISIASFLVSLGFFEKVIKLKKHLRNGDLYYEIEDYGNAIIEYQEAIKSNPSFTKAFYKLAFTYYINDNPYVII